MKWKWKVKAVNNTIADSLFHFKKMILTQIIQSVFFQSVPGLLIFHLLYIWEPGRAFLLGRWEVYICELSRAARSICLIWTWGFSVIYLYLHTYLYLYLHLHTYLYLYLHLHAYLYLYLQALKSSPQHLSDVNLRSCFSVLYLYLYLYLHTYLYLYLHLHTYLYLYLGLFINDVITGGGGGDKPKDDKWWHEDRGVKYDEDISP